MKIKSFFILLLACALLFAGCKVETDAPDSPASPAPSAAPTDFVLYRADSFRIGSQAYEKCSFNEDISKKYAALIGKAADALAGETQVYCLVIPTAYGVLLPDDMKELIPDYSDMETNISSIYAALPESVEPVPVWDKLREHSGEFIYFRTDPHWTARGAYLGYEAFCEAKGIAPIPLDAHRAVNFDGFLGTLYFENGCR